MPASHGLDVELSSQPRSAVGTTARHSLELPPTPGSAGRAAQTWLVSGSRRRLRVTSIISEGGVVGRDHLGGQVAGGGPVDDVADREHRACLGELLPPQESFRRPSVSSWQPGVAYRNLSEPVRLGGDQPQADETTPVLAEEGDRPRAIDRARRSSSSTTRMRMTSSVPACRQTS